MNITRIGFVSLIVGLILLLNASSSHVSGHSSVSRGAFEENQTQTYLILIGSVGPATIGIGLPVDPPRGIPEEIRDESITGDHILPDGRGGIWKS